MQRPDKLLITLDLADAKNPAIEAAQLLTALASRLQKRGVHDGHLAINDASLAYDFTNQREN